MAELALAGAELALVGAELARERSEGRSSSGSAAMSEDDAVHAAAGAEAHWIMQKADSLCPDGTVSLLEMCTFIKDSEHEGFLEWLLQDRYHPGGKFEYHEEFHKANTNHDSKLDMKELTAAVESWMKLGSPGLSVPRRVEVKEAEMTDKERELIAFRVPGIPDVVLPPPPQKKRSIYEKSYPQSTGYKPTMDSGTMRTGFNSTAFEASPPPAMMASVKASATTNWNMAYPYHSEEAGRRSNFSSGFIFEPRSGHFAPGGVQCLKGASRRPCHLGCTKSMWCQCDKLAQTGSQLKFSNTARRPKRCCST